MLGIVAAMAACSTISGEPHTSGATGRDFQVPCMQRLVVSGHSFFFYLGKILLPLRLTFVYPRWEINVWDWRQYLWPLAAAAVLAGLYRGRRILGRGFFAAAMHFYISTSFLVFMVVLYRMKFSFVADHWLYFGSMSIFALAGARPRHHRGGPRRLGPISSRRGPPSASSCCSALCRGGRPGCTRTSTPSGAGRSRAIPTAGWPRATSATNSWTAAILRNPWRICKEAIALKPDYVLAMNNLHGKVYMLKHDIDSAIAEYKTALAINPENAETLNNLGYAYQLKGRVVEAIALYQKALTITPSHVLIRNNLSSALLHEGRVVWRRSPSLPENHRDRAGRHDRLE